MKTNTDFALLSLGILISAQSLIITPAIAQDASGRQTKDFVHRKRMIVPASEISRRIDYQSLPGRDSLMLPNYVPKFPPAGAGSADTRYTENLTGTESDPYASGLPPSTTQGELSATAGSLGSSSSTGSRKPMTRTSRAGLTPPAPPVKSSLLPSSLTKNTATPEVAARATAGKLSAPPLSLQKVSQIKAQAQALVKKGKPAEAQELLSGYVKTYPQEQALSNELSKISLQRAQSHAKAGNHEAATQQARQAIFHGENSPETTQAAHSTLNSSLQKIGVKASAPADRFDLGTKLMGQARYDEAMVEYGAAAKLKPTVEAYLGAGGAAMKGGHQLKAKTYFQDALELNPDSQPALRELGIARYHLKDYVGANADLTRALVLNSGDQEAAHSLLDLWHHQVAARPEDANAHMGLARAYQVVGDLPAAQNEYKTVVKIHPQHPNLPAARQSFKLAYARQEARKSYDLAQTLEKQGSISAAYQKASDAVQLYPSDTNYQGYRAILAAKLQNSQGMGAPVALTGAAAGMAATAGMGVPAAAEIATNNSTLVPGSTPEAPPNAIPTAQAIGLAPEAATGAISTAPFAHENMYQPISTDRQVSSISNFLVSMRNFTMQQQDQIQQAQDASPWSTSSRRSSTSAVLDNDAALGATSAISPTASGLPSAVQALPQSGGAADALKAAAMALANTKGTAAVSTTTTSAVTSAADQAATEAPSGYAGLAMQARQSMLTAGQKAVSRFTSRPAATAPTGTGSASTASTATSAQMADLPAPSPTLPSYQAASQYTAPTYNPYQASAQTQASAQSQASAMAQAQIPAMAQPQSLSTSAPQYDQISQINSLQTNNQQLQAQLAQANSYIQQMQSGNNAGVAQNQVSSVSGQQQQQQQQQQYGQQYAQPQTSSPASQMPEHSQTLPALRPPVETKKALPTGSVRLLLQGVKAAKDDVQLKVLLRNETNQEIKLPGNMKALVRSTTQPEREGKASFSAKTLSPGSTANGTIKITGSNLDPTADVIIPASSLAIIGVGDLHLSVPISQR